MFKVGDKIVYPMHGAGTIEAIEQREMLGDEKDYYIIKMPIGDMKLMVPTDKADDIGVREVSSKNISDATCANIYTVLSTVFSEFGNIYVSDLGEMHLRYSFEFLLSDTMYAILRQTRVVPRPAGVGIEIYEIPSRKIIGFNGQELGTFDNGTFFQGVREWEV